MVDTLYKKEQSKEYIPVSVNLCNEEELFLIGKKIPINYKDLGHQVIIAHSGTAVSIDEMLSIRHGVLTIKSLRVACCAYRQNVNNKTWSPYNKVTKSCLL